MDRRELLRTGVSLGLAGVVGGRSVSGTDWLTQAEAETGSARTRTILLNSNENPLGLAPAARDAVGQAVAEAHRYPDASRDGLARRLADSEGLDRDSVVLGNGSTEILQMIVQAGSAPNATLVLADPTFEAVSRYQRPLPYRVEKIPLQVSSFAHDIERMREVAAALRRPLVVYVCNPNNPTGTLTASAAIDSWIEEAPETVLFAIDEAYHEYVTAPGYWSAVKWVRSRPNVIVVRTFSKIYAMAGLRLGYAFAHPRTAVRLREFMSSDNANHLALVAAAASLQDNTLIDRSRRANAVSMKIVQDCLDELGLSYLPSHTNFLMHEIKGELRAYIREMRDRGFRVGRPFPPLLEYNRLSMGSPEEMQGVAEAWRDLRSAGRL